MLGEMLTLCGAICHNVLYARSISQLGLPFHPSQL